MRIATPFEEVLGDIQTGLLSVPEGLERAAGPQAVAALSPAAVGEIAELAENTVRSDSRSAGAMLLLLELVLAAVDEALAQHGDDASMRAMRSDAALSFVEVARMKLIAAADGALHRHAVELGEWVAEDARAAGDREREGSALHRLGTLHLDPRGAGRSTEAYQEAEIRWQQRAMPDAERMPDALEALRRADDLLRRASGLRAPPARGLALKARADAMMWRRVLGGDAEVPKGELAAVARAALAELDPGESPQLRLAMLNLLRTLDEPFDADELDRTLERSLDDRLRRLGPESTMDLVLQAAPLLRAVDPARGLTLSLAAAPLARRLREELRIAHLRAEITTLSRGLSGGEEPTVVPGELQAAARALAARADAEEWDVTRLFGGVLALVLASGDNDEEAVGLALLAGARERVAPLLAERHADSLNWLEATLSLAVGVNGVEARDLPAAVEGYARSLAGFVALDLGSVAQNCLARIADVVREGKGGTDMAVELVRGIAPVALGAERLVGPSAADRIRDCARHILGSSAGDLPVDSALFAFEVAKGLRFATALYGGSRYRWAEDEHGQELLAAIAEEERRLGPEPWRPLDEDVLLADYQQAAPPDGDKGAAAPRARVAGLRARYDEHVWEQLLRGAAAEEALWLGADDVREALGDRTALITFFLGVRPADGMPATAALVLTRHGATRHVLPLSGRWMEFWGEISEGHGALGLEARITVALRERVQEDPAWRVVSRSAEPLLAADYESYFGAGAILEGLRDVGIDHLCLVPHGALHFHPLHLLGSDGEALADDWIVTLMPNLSLFVARRGLPAVRRYRDRDLTSFGLAFESRNAHGLPPIRRSAAEAAAVGGVYAVPPVPESRATEAEVRAALERSRFVHLSTHGRHAADAPAFQCLYLTPDGGSDGRLEAHELLALDLRGLDLLTLSACETGLGRFDASDNLRGLPGALLMSGCSTLVCTLWEVAADVSEQFFVELYGSLHQGAGVLDAFRAAQVATRSEFPAYRDWGAFYLAGDWVW